jgi:hypothetical protein
MDKPPYSVSVVLDREFGPKTRQLLEGGPVWLVDSSMNRDTAQMLWSEFPQRNHLDGVTVFKSELDRDPAQILIDEMPTIDEHHGMYSTDPPYTVLRVIGCELKSEVQETLAGLGFDSFSRTSEGFVAKRPVPRQMGE